MPTFLRKGFGHSKKYIFQFFQSGNLEENTLLMEPWGVPVPYW